MSSSSSSSSSSSATAITSRSSSVVSSSGPEPPYRSLLAMMSLDKFVQENSAEIRHQKLLANIVKILKINDLLEEYRSVVHTLQGTCTCKKSGPTWESVTSLEGRYKELLLESSSTGSSARKGELNNPTTVSSALALKEVAQLQTLPTSTTISKTCKTNGSSPTAKMANNQAAVAAAAAAAASASATVTSSHSGCTSPTTTNVLNFSIFNSLKSESVTAHNHNNHNLSLNSHNNAANLNLNLTHHSFAGHVSQSKAGVKASSQEETIKRELSITSTHINGHGVSPAVTANGAANLGALSPPMPALTLKKESPLSPLSLPPPPSAAPYRANATNTIEVVVDQVLSSDGGGHSGEPAADADNDATFIEEEDILEDEEDDAEEELDIEEYMALSEILEKEADPKRFQREEDAKNEFILAIRDTRSTEIICYECIVGGSCGFLSRERARMLLHIGKHFAAISESDDGEVVSEDEEDDDEFADDEVLPGKDLDISLIPLHPDAGVKHLAATLASSSGASGQLQHHQQQQQQTTGSRRPKRAGHPSKATLCKQAAAQKALLLELQQQQLAGNHKIISKPFEKPIHCEYASCNFQCDQNYKLRTHIRQVHEKVRPYLCDWPGCFGAYKTRSNLASHRMVHTGERPFICDYAKCGAKFARKYDCERHRRIHSEKMFACEWPGCGKRLCDPYNLERHMMVHKGELPFRCPIGKCIRGFRELRYLRDHMVNTHKFLPDTNQLRSACLNSSRVSSISGYNLNETDDDEEAENSAEADMSAFMSAIMNSTAAAATAAAAAQMATKNLANGKAATGGASSKATASSSGPSAKSQAKKVSNNSNSKPVMMDEQPVKEVVVMTPKVTPSGKKQSSTDPNNNLQIAPLSHGKSGPGGKSGPQPQASPVSGRAKRSVEKPATAVVPVPVEEETQEEPPFEPPMTRRSKRMRTK